MYSTVYCTSHLILVAQEQETGTAYILSYQGYRIWCPVSCENAYSWTVVHGYP